MENKDFMMVKDIICANNGFTKFEVNTLGDKTKIVDKAIKFEDGRDLFDYVESICKEKCGYEPYDKEESDWTPHCQVHMCNCYVSDLYINTLKLAQLEIIIRDEREKDENRCDFGCHKCEKYFANKNKNNSTK